MIRAIQDRRLYRRLAVLSGVRKPDKYKTIYSRFRNYRLEEDYKAIEDRREKWEREILDLVGEQMKEDPKLIPRGKTKDQVMLELRSVVPLILVDVPVKAISETSEANRLRYLMEDFAGVHSRKSAFFPDFDEIPIDFEQDSFDVEVGKIRVLGTVV